MTGISELIQLGLGIIEKVIPDPEEKARLKIELLKAEQEGKLKELEISMSAILAEAKSSDPWTSRARPSFMYVVYLLILMGIPMGFLSAVEPETAKQISFGLKDWLESIPSDLIDLFQWVMLGYVGARSVEKVKKVAK